MWKPADTPKLLPLLMPLPGEPNNGIQVQVWDEEWVGGGGRGLNSVDGDKRATVEFRDLERNHHRAIGCEELILMKRRSAPETRSKATV